MAEKTNASPQNSAFEFRTLQDSQCSVTFPKSPSKIWNVSFRNVSALRCFIFFGSQNEENISRLNLPKWADNQYNRKGGFSHLSTFKNRKR